MKPVNIRLQNSSVREGIVENPVVAWEYTSMDAGKHQCACRILLRKNGQELVYDSGKMETSAQNGHCLPCTLQTHTSYDLCVHVWDGTEEESGVSEPFVSGVCTEEDWKGSWIGCGRKDPFYAVRYFSLPEDVTQAYLSVAATGQYVCRINAETADESVLNGSWTDFHKRIHYRTFSIASRLQKGYNSISIEVGNGWYLGYQKDDRHFYTIGMHGYKAYGEELGIKAVLTLYKKDGSIQRIGTDEQWKIAPSSVTYTNIYGSEDMHPELDGRPWERYEAFTQPAKVLRETAPKGKLLPALYPPIHCVSTHEATRVWQYENGDEVYDLGQNMAGFFELFAEGCQGDCLRVSCTEVWQPGQPFTPKTNSWCDLFLTGNTPNVQSFCPRFTYVAGRYLLVSHIQRTSPESGAVVRVLGRFLTTAMEKTGSFACSDHRYMQIYDLILKAADSNLKHVHTDCPTVERLGWQEPNHLMGPSIMYMKNVDTFWEKIEYDQVDSQYADGEEEIDLGTFPHRYSAGLLPSIAPTYARFLHAYDCGSFWDIIPWGSSLVMGLMERRRFYGVKGDLETFYPSIRKFTDYQYDKYLHYKEIYNGTEDVHFLKHGLGDWGTWNQDDNSRENVETAYLYQNLMLTAQLAEEAEDYETAKLERSRAQKLCQEYNDLLLVQDKQTGEWYYRSYQDSPAYPVQTNQTLPFWFGMVPEDKRESVKKSFLRAVKDHRILTGEVGLPYLFRMLGEMKQPDIVQDMIFQKEHPSYYRFVEKGETTLPEFWDDEARSRNHDMMGSIMEWFYRYMAGISSDDGYQTVQICPQLPSGVQYVKCSYRAITGLVEVFVYRDCENRVCLQCSIPANTRGVARLGNQEKTLEGGIQYLLREDVK